MRTHLRRPGAAALLLAAVLTVSGCSSGQDEDTSAKASPAASESGLSAAERVEQELDEDSEQEGEKDTEDAKDAAGESPAPSAKPEAPESVRPDAELTPATGSFTKDEKEYLSGRVPESVEPAAVLDLGKETCQRIERTAKRDQDAVVSALIRGELTDPEEAVTHLCPEQKPVLEAAKGGYPDGTHKDPTAGTYRTLDAGSGCTWSVTGADGKALAVGPEGGAKEGQEHKVTIPGGAASFTSADCGAWARG
ncbi:hypothetical protein JJV70_03220 [Streptomyces sp. JJ66]|uniref:hypothetical protein n=1 Tax=Streptomyces sp. JJ66 TaxID=2803843 RepID=UPI001C580F35|nr:hypothetical protein [Streptomyces sp. JJ66]MBW1601128.1 hypothetical protein [Streptomyces sp. JJ66]